VPISEVSEFPIGTKVRAYDGHLCLSLRDAHGGDPSEWPEDLRIRQFLETAR
jgi:hypothetical protein